MKKISFILLAAILGICISGCESEKDQNITIGVMPSENILPIIYGVESGIFEEYGINLDVEIFKSAVDRDTAFQTGNLDGVASDMLSAVFLNNAGFDVKITAEDITNFKVISVTEGEDKDAKTIGISKSTVIEYVSDMYISTQSLSFEPTFVPAVPVRLELLNKKELDMAVLPEPLASVPQDAVVITTSNEMGLYPGVHMFSAEAIESKDLKNFYKAYNKAVEQINSGDIDEFKSILIDSIGFSEDAFSNYTLPIYNTAIPSKEDQFNDVMNWMVEKEYCDKIFTLDEISDFDFIK